MKATEVKTGQTYRVKVGHNSTEVKIISINPKGGWEAVNVRTGKPVNIKSASRIVSASKPDATKEPGASKPAANGKESNTGEPVATDANTQRKPLSLLNAAAIVLEACDRPLSCNEIIEKAVDADIWQPKAGKTPANTLYASILREISKKGTDSRFVKAERGKFQLSR